MACDSKTPWSITNYEYTLNRLRTTSGGHTNQSTGAWTPKVTSSIEVCGYIGRGTTKGASGLRTEDLVSLAGGMFKSGDLFYVCHSDCDIEINDVIEQYVDEAGTTKVNWRVVTKLKELSTYKNLMGYSQSYWLVRREI